MARAPLSLVDQCVYPDVAHTPDRKLSMLFCKFSIPDPQRVRMAQSITDSYRMSLIAATEADLPQQLSVLLGDQMPADAPENALARKIITTNS